MKDKVIKILKKFLNRETMLYAFFGVLTSVLNVVLFQVLLWIRMEYKIANLLTLVIVKLTAYLCNKNFVFCSKCENMLELAKEFLRFLVARGATALIDYFGLILLVEIFHADKLLSKVFITVLVIVINYITGKKHVFKKKNSKKVEGGSCGEKCED